MPFDRAARLGAAGRADRPLSLPYKRDPKVRHLTDATADEAIALIDAQPAGLPFALTVSFNAPTPKDFDPAKNVWPEATDALYRQVVVPPVSFAGRCSCRREIVWDAEHGSRSGEIQRQSAWAESSSSSG